MKDNAAARIVATGAAVGTLVYLGRRLLRPAALPPPPDGVEDFVVAAPLGPFRSFADVFKRARCWLKVLLEWPELCRVCERHRSDGWFDYGSPPACFADVGQHPAVKALLALRADGGRSTLEWEADHAVLPTYLRIEESAAAALGAVAIAAADLFELRTGRAQRVVVNQSGAGLTTAQCARAPLFPPRSHMLANSRTPRRTQTCSCTASRAASGAGSTASTARWRRRAQSSRTARRTSAPMAGPSSFTAASPS